MECGGAPPLSVTTRRKLPREPQLTPSTSLKRFRNLANSCFNSAISARNDATSLSNRATSGHRRLRSAPQHAPSRHPAQYLATPAADASTSPDNKCMYRDSLVPGARGNTLANAGSRLINFCNAACTSLKSSNCTSAPRARAIPRESAPRATTSTHKTAVSGRVKLNASCKRCSYFRTRLSEVFAAPANSNSLRLPHRRGHASSSRFITGSRFDF